MTDRPDRGDEAIRTVTAWNDAWGARDLETMKRIAADDFIQWHATIRRELSKDEEFDMLVKALDVMHIQFKDIRLTALGDGAVLQQCVADIDIAGVGARSDVPFAMVFRTRGDRITRCDEYMDSLSLPRIDFTPTA